MRIRQLSLRPYRNFAAREIPFGDGDTLIVGGNGRGKSNILEAISYLSIGKSIRGARDQEAVPFGGNVFDIQAQWNDGQRERHLRVFYSAGEGKRIFVDGAPLDRVSDVLTLLQTVHFSPEGVALVLRLAGQRRRLLDILLSQSSGQYLRDLQRYQRVVTQRNQGLKDWAHWSADEQAAWDRQLAKLGAAIRRRRLAALAQLQPYFVEYYRRFSAGREEADLAYRERRTGPDGELPAEGELEEELLAELGGVRQHEQRAGFSLCGPHRDSLAFALDGVPADVYGSQGQLKSILVSWKMAELRFLEAQSGQQPVLLLDDVFSELDRERSGRLMDLIGDFEQVVLTAPRALDLSGGPAFAEVDLDA